jgi:hypothetical protein
LEWNIDIDDSLKSKISEYINNPENQVGFLRDFQIAITQLKNGPNIEQLYPERWCLTKRRAYGLDGNVGYLNLQCTYNESRHKITINNISLRKDEYNERT